MTSYKGFSRNTTQQLPLPQVATQAAETSVDEDERRSKPVFLTGTIMQLSARVWSGGWTHGTLEHLDLEGKKTVSKISGILAGLKPGDEVEVVGSFTYHESRGRQLEVEHAGRVLPKKEEAIQAWIAQELPDIGPERAKALVDKHGVKFFDVLDGNDWYEALTEVSGITDQRALDIYDAYQSKKHQFMLFNYLVGLNLSSKEIKAAFRIGVTQADIEADLCLLYYRKVLPVHRLTEVLLEHKPEVLETDSYGVVMLHYTLHGCTDDGSTAVRLDRARKELGEMLEQVPPSEEILRIVKASKDRVAYYNGFLLPGELARDESTIARFVRGSEG